MWAHRENCNPAAVWINLITIMSEFDQRQSISKSIQSLLAVKSHKWPLRQTIANWPVGAYEKVQPCCCLIQFCHLTSKLNQRPSKTKSIRSQVAPPAGKRQLTGGRKAKQLQLPEERNTILSHWFWKQTFERRKNTTTNLWHWVKHLLVLRSAMLYIDFDGRFVEKFWKGPEGNIMENHNILHIFLSNLYHLSNTCDRNLMFTESTHMGPVWATKTTFLRLTVPVAHMTHAHKPLKLLNNCWR